MESGVPDQKIGFAETQIVSIFKETDAGCGVKEVCSTHGLSEAAFYIGSRNTGTRFRTFNVINDFNRESLAVEVGTSLTGCRLIHFFERLWLERGLLP